MVKFVRVCVPDVALLPDHPPLAVQEVELVDDQVKVDEFPVVTPVGLADNVTVGDGVGGGGVEIAKLHTV